MSPTTILQTRYQSHNDGTLQTRTSYTISSTVWVSWQFAITGNRDVAGGCTACVYVRPIAWKE